MKYISMLLSIVMMLSFCTITNETVRAENVSVAEYLLIDHLENAEGHIYVTKDEQYADMVQKVMQEVRRKKCPGSIVIATDQQILWASGTDALQFDGEEVTPYTTYQIGSVTKVFTAAGLLKLVEDGTVSLDDTMEQYFPEYETIRGVSVRNLLYMNSGIADFVNAPDKAFPEKMEEFFSDAMAEALTEEKMHEYMKHIALVFEPGSKYEYSNTNYYLLASIIEKVTGRSFHEYLKETVFEPLGMNATVCGDLGKVECAYDASMIKPRFDSNPPLTKGSGDIVTNALDLLQFDRALYSGDLLGEEGMEMMFDFKDGYSCGWMKDYASSTLHTGGNYWKAEEESDIYHQGRIPGFYASNIVLNHAEERIYVIILFGVDEKEKADLTSRVGSILKFIS